MRPRPEGLAALQTRLGIAQESLTRARALLAGEAGATVEALAEVEAAARELADQMTVSGQVERNLQENIAEHEEVLAVLRTGLALALKTRENLAARAAAAGDDIRRLRAKLETERERFAPLVERREHDVERLERRIKTRLSYHPEQALPALFPGRGAPTMSERYAEMREAEAAAAKLQPPIGAAGGEPAAPPAPALQAQGGAA